jgi:hypothetical protein
VAIFVVTSLTADNKVSRNVFLGSLVGADPRRNGMNWMVGDIGEKREGVAVAGGGDRGG